MNDIAKTKKQLIDELEETRRQVKGLQDLVSMAERSQNQPDFLSSLIRDDRFKSLILESAPNPVMVLNADRSIFYVNPAYEQLTGFSASEVVSQKPPYPHWLCKSIPGTEIGMKEFLDRNYSSRTDVPFQKKNGEIFWVDAVSTRINGPDGQPGSWLINWVDITQRKKTEDALRESEKRFREIAELLPEIVFEIDKKGNLLYANKTANAVFQDQETIPVGINILSYLAPEDKNRTVSNIGRILQGEDLGTVEYTARRADGSLFPILIHSCPIKNDLGEVTGLRGVMVDISTRKAVENELRESQEFASSLLKFSPYPILVTNPDGSISYVNPALEKLTGYSGADLLGLHRPYPWWPPDKLEEYTLSLTSNERRTGNPHEWLFRKKNGELFWVFLVRQPVKENRQVKFYISNWVDITERKKAEDALKESEAFNFRLFADSPNPILVTNPDTSIKFANTAFEKLTGFSAGELVGTKMPYPWWPSEKRSEYQNEVTGGKHVVTGPEERYLRKKNGEPFWININFATIKDQEKTKYYITNWVDITERKKAEEERREALEKLEELYIKEKAQRQELEEEAKARGMFIDVLAHELRTPLTPILASTGMLNDLLLSQNDDIAQKLAENISRSALIMNSRLEELLDLARYSRGTFKLNLKPTNTQQFIRDIVSRFESTLFQRKQRLVLELSQNLPVAQMDPSRIEQVILNLLTNAGKFSPENSLVTLVAGTEDDHLVVSVKDNGIGISLEEQKRLFQPYHRVEQDRQKFPGIGLGLAVSRQIVEAHGGKIWVTSEPFKGSIFSFKIPLK